MTTPTEPEFAIDDLRRLAAGLREVVRKTTGLPHVAFDPDQGQSPETIAAAMPGSAILYVLRGSSGEGKANREMGGEVQLFKLRSRDAIHDVWLSGFMRLRKRPRKMLVLDTLSWSFYTGRARSDENEMRLRAEWHHDRSHPQPHWHFHDEFLLARDHTEDLSIGYMSRLHLPMAGWTNSKESSPLCWCHPASSDPSVFVGWSKQVLEVAGDQLSHLLDRAGV